MRLGEGGAPSLLHALPGRRNVMLATLVIVVSSVLAVDKSVAAVAVGGSSEDSTESDEDVWRQSSGRSAK